MNPCDICGKRILAYPGVCDSCTIERTMMFKTQWKASYDANTARHESSQIMTPDIDHVREADRLDARDKNRSKNKKKRR